LKSKREIIGLKFRIFFENPLEFVSAIGGKCLKQTAPNQLCRVRGYLGMPLGKLGFLSPKDKNLGQVVVW